MSVIYAVRTLFVCLAVPAVVLTAGMGSATNAPEEPTVSVRAENHWDASTGRLCPREVGYGKFDQPITVQDT